MPAAQDSELILTVDSEEAMRRVGQCLGRCAVSGLIVALTGTLGAGKTRFVQAAAEGLGVPREDVNSPTFVLIHEYAGRLPVFHFDTYRLRDIDEFLELGVDDYMHGDGACFIEWAERMDEVLPRDRLKLMIEITGATQRRLTFQAGGPSSRAVLAELRQQSGI